MLKTFIVIISSISNSHVFLLKNVSSFLLYIGYSIILSIMFTMFL